MDSCAQTPADWEVRVVRTCRPGRQILAVAARRDGEFVAMMGGYVDPDMLLATVHHWAEHEADVAWAGLEVLETNAHATRFYQRNGHTDTGVRRPYPNDPTLNEIVMTRPLIDSRNSDRQP